MNTNTRLQEILKDPLFKSLQDILREVTAEDLEILHEHQGVPEGVSALGRTDREKSLLTILYSRLQRGVPKNVCEFDIYAENGEKAAIVNNVVDMEDQLLSSRFEEWAKSQHNTRKLLSTFVNEEMQNNVTGASYYEVNLARNKLLDVDLPHLLRYVTHFSIYNLWLHGNHFSCATVEDAALMWKIVDAVKCKVVLYDTPAATSKSKQTFFTHLFADEEDGGNGLVRARKLIWIPATLLKSRRWEQLVPYANRKQIEMLYSTHYVNFYY